MHDLVKIRNIEFKLKCKVIKYDDNCIIEKDGYYYNMYKGSVSRFKFSTKNMTKESYIQYINTNKFNNTEFKCIDIIDKNFMLVLNTSTNIKVKHPKHTISLEVLKNVTTKTDKYLELLNTLDLDVIESTNHSQGFVTINCKTHGNYTANFSNIFYKNSRCPICALENREFGKKGFIKACTNNGTIPILYIIKLYNNDEIFYKVGVTQQRNYKNRFKGFPYNVEELKIYTGTPECIYDMEQLLHKNLKKFRYEPKIIFAGSTETYIENDILLLKIDMFINNSLTLLRN